MFEKYAGNPILSPEGNGWESWAVFNPAAWTDGSQVYLLYRGEHRPTSCQNPISSIGLATSADGIIFQRRPTPVLWPAEPYERMGCEDPRLTTINNTFYLTYTAYDGEMARIALAVSQDLLTWEKRGLLFPERGWTKSAAIISHAIREHYWMYFGDTNIWAAHSEDLLHWTIVEDPVLVPRGDSFDSRLVEPGPPPIVTSQGLHFIYNSADQALRYAVGQCLLAHDDPQRVLYRSNTPILQPETEAEITGQVPNVVFAEGLVYFKGRWLLYYGMADSRIGVAISSADSLEISREFYNSKGMG